MSSNNSTALNSADSGADTSEHEVKSVHEDTEETTTPSPDASEELKNVIDVSSKYSMKKNRLSFLGNKDDMKHSSEHFATPGSKKPTMNNLALASPSSRNSLPSLTVMAHKRSL